MNCLTHNGKRNSVCLCQTIFCLAPKLVAFGTGNDRAYKLEKINKVLERESAEIFNLGAAPVTDTHLTTARIKNQFAARAWQVKLRTRPTSIQSWVGLPSRRAQRGVARRQNASMAL